jgi:hypothetical protein
MIPADTQVFLRSGTVLTAAEVFEALATLAKNENTFPLLAPSDESKAVVNVAFEAIEWAREEGVFDAP